MENHEPLCKVKVSEKHKNFPKKIGTVKNSFENKTVFNVAIEKKINIVTAINRRHNATSQRNKHKKTF